MQDTFARARTWPSARATIVYLVYNSHARNDIFELMIYLNKILGPVFVIFLKDHFAAPCFISALRRIGSLPNFAVLLVMIYLNYLQNLNKI